jgi:hypothetical protein
MGYESRVVPDQLNTIFLLNRLYMSCHVITKRGEDRDGATEFYGRGPKLFFFFFWLIGFFFFFFFGNV